MREAVIVSGVQDSYRQGAEGDAGGGAAEDLGGLVIREAVSAGRGA